MIIPTTDNITKSHTFTAQNWLRSACQIMCLLLVLPLIACGSGATGTGTGTDGTGPGGNDGMGPGGTDGTVDKTFVAYLEEGDLTLNNFLKTDTGKAVGEDDHLRHDLGLLYKIGGFTDLAIEAGTEANTIKIIVKEEISDLATEEQKNKRGFVETLSYTDPDSDGRFELKKGTDDWGQGLFSSNSDGSTVMGLISEDRISGKDVLNQAGTRASFVSFDNVFAVTGKEYVWEQKDDGSINDQGLSYTFGGKALTTAVGDKIVATTLPLRIVKNKDKDVHFTMTLNIPTTEQAKTKNLPEGADAVLSITDWYLTKDINAEQKNYLPLPAAVSLKGGVGSNNLRLVKGDGMNYIDDRFLNFGTFRDISNRRGGNRKGRRFNESEAKTDFYKEVFTSSITARLYGEPGSLAKNKAVIAGIYIISITISSNIQHTSWGVYLLKQQ